MWCVLREDVNMILSFFFIIRIDLYLINEKTRLPEEKLTK